MTDAERAVIEAAKAFSEATDLVNEDGLADRDEIWEHPSAGTINAGMLRQLQAAVAALEAALNGETRE